MSKGERPDSNQAADNWIVPPSIGGYTGWRVTNMRKTYLPLSRQMLGIGELGQRGISRETGSGFSIAPDPCNGIEYHMFLGSTYTN
jgi:hypothetical protein